MLEEAILQHQQDVDLSLNLSQASGTFHDGGDLDMSGNMSQKKDRTAKVKKEPGLKGQTRIFTLQVGVQ